MIALFHWILLILKVVATISRQVLEIGFFVINNLILMNANSNYRVMLSASICRRKLVSPVAKSSGTGAASMAFVIILMMASQIHGHCQTGSISSSQTKFWEREHGKLVIILWRF